MRTCCADQWDGCDDPYPVYVRCRHDLAYDVMLVSQAA